MRQRVSLVRALVHDPPLLLMDEPFGALDAITRDQMSIDIQKLWLERKQTVLFVTHSLSEAIFLSDRVIVMTPRPARVERELTIELPRPRTLDVRESPEFGRLAREIREIFLAQGILRQ
jgi:NitT/TauT family transport system ATP-binding protein